MFHQLTPQHYTSIRPLLAEYPTPSLYCQGILAGKYPGKVVVDQADAPRSALVVKDSWYHLLGDPYNASFNEALRLALANKELIGEGTGAIFFVDPSEAWCAVLSGLVENRQPIKMPRCLYAATQGHPIHTPALPEGFELRFIDESLVDLVEGELPKDVQKVLALRQGAALPDEMGFGYVALHGRACTAWSVVDFIVGDEGEIRLVTEGGYRRRGLAFTTSAATIVYGLSHGLRQINWDVAASNTGSIRTAEKLGLRRLRQPTEYIIIFPEVGYLINLAWSHLDSHRFEQTQAVTAQMVTSDKEILVRYGHFLAGAAWAGLADQAKAIDQLNKAIDAGFDDLPEMENCAPLKRLHGSPEWEQLLTRIQKSH